MCLEHQIQTLALGCALNFFAMTVCVFAALSSAVMIFRKRPHYKDVFGLLSFSFAVGAMMNMLLPADSIQHYWKVWTVGLISSTGCCILNKIICFRKEAFKILMEDFFIKIDKIKSALVYADVWFSHKEWLLYAVLTFTSGLYIFAFGRSDLMDGTYIFSILCFAGLYFLWLIPAYRSCRWLLAVLFLGPFLFYEILEPIVAADVAAFHDTPEMTKMFLRMLFFIAFWCITSLLADEKPIKLALQIVNTATTLLALGINIFAPYLEAEIISQMGETFPSGAVSVYLNGKIFPLVAAGYISLLLKEAQLYGREKK